MKVFNQYFETVVDGLMDWGVEDFVYVPSSHSAPVIKSLESRGVRAIKSQRRTSPADKQISESGGNGG